MGLASLVKHREQPDAARAAWLRRNLARCSGLTSVPHPRVAYYISRRLAHKYVGAGNLHVSGVPGRGLCAWRRRVRPGHCRDVDHTRECRTCRDYAGMGKTILSTTYNGIKPAQKKDQYLKPPREKRNTYSSIKRRRERGRARVGHCRLRKGRRRREGVGGVSCAGLCAPHSSREGKPTVVCQG